MCINHFLWRVDHVDLAELVCLSTASVDGTVSGRKRFNRYPRTTEALLVMRGHSGGIHAVSRQYLHKPMVWVVTLPETRWKIDFTGALLGDVAFLNC